jgi:hypothetical protein
LTATGLPMRAILLSHRRGVRWFAPDDYRWDSSGQVDTIKEEVP